MKRDAVKDNTNFFMGKNLEGGKVDLAGGKVQDLFDEEGLFEEIKAEGNIILD